MCAATRDKVGMQYIGTCMKYTNASCRFFHSIFPLPAHLFTVAPDFCTILPLTTGSIPMLI